MKGNNHITNLEQLLDRLGAAGGRRDCVAVGKMIEVVGRKSFGPLLVLAGLIAFSPLSGIPGVPTTVALLVLLTACQLLFGRKHFWLPKWLMTRAIPRDKFEKTLKLMRPMARLIDRFSYPRLTLLTRNTGVYVIAIVCILVAATMPPLEIIPFAATTAGAALTAFGLSLIAHDGVMALVALGFTALVATLAARTFF